MGILDRTFHPDEANQAMTTGRLLETGTYQYNPQDHHGPTLYYAAAAIQKAAGHSTTTELDATLLRCTPLVFAALALVFGFLAVRKITKRTWLGALFAVLLGTSPIFAFFATDFIQEMLLASFTMMMLWSGVSYWHSAQPSIPRPQTADRRQPTAKIKPGTCALLFGIFAGLALATKETAILTFAAAALAGIPILWRCRKDIRLETRDVALSVLGFALTATLLFSSFASNWQGVYNAFIAAPLSYVHRAAGSAASQGAAAHVHPWWQYLKWLFADGHGFMLFFVLCGTVNGSFAQFVWLRFRPASRSKINGHLLQAFIFMLTYSIILLALYSSIPYKTPWCALQPAVALLLAALLGLAVGSEVYVAINSLGMPQGWPVRWKSVFDWWHNHPRMLYANAAMTLMIASALLLYDNIQGLAAINRDPDSKAIQYNYASASPQVKELASLVHSTLNAQSTDTNAFAAIALPPEDTWPLPFYLRTIKDRVGYWTQFGELEALAGLGRKPTVVVTPAEEGHLVQPLFPHLKNTKRFEMRHRVRVRAFW